MKGATGASRPDLSSVAAAIHTVLQEMAGGARYYVCADIRSFFTRISKKSVLGIIAEKIADDEFLEFLEKAVTVELANIAQLKHHAKDFPTSDIGVAQGSSLSPLFGNIALADFDRQMNQGDCRCIRYVDDFIILAPSARAATARLRRANSLLKVQNMDLSPEKTTRGAQPLDRGVEFLGIEIVAGLIRPSQKARSKLLKSVKDELERSLKSFAELPKGKPLKRTNSLVATLKRVDDMVHSWGKHYRFCNDQQSFNALNEAIFNEVVSYLSRYKRAREKVDDTLKQTMLGLCRLEKDGKRAFQYPKKSHAKESLVEHLLSFPGGVELRRDESSPREVTL